MTVASTFINDGYESVSLAATVTKGPYAIGSAKCVGVRCSFSSTGTFDAVGTLALKVGPSSDKLTVLAFKDDSGDTVTTKAVTSADDDTTFLFDDIKTSEGKLWAVYTSTSDGDDDSVLLEVLTKDS